MSSPSSRGVISLGVMPNAGVGEAGHQRHKRGNKSGSGREMAKHHMRRVNTQLALEALLDGTSWKARKYSRRDCVHKTVRVRPGADCVATLKKLDAVWAGGLVAPRRKRDSENPSPRWYTGQFTGSANWKARLWENVLGQEASFQEKGVWQSAVQNTHMRPDKNVLLEAMVVWFACGRVEGEALCGERRCPDCWEGGRRADIQSIYIQCSRYLMDAGRSNSSGLGRLRGGNVRTAGQVNDQPHDWSLGNGAGKDVEIFVNRAAANKPAAQLKPIHDLTTSKLLYFFAHEGNRRSEDGPRTTGAITSWVCVFNYTTAGRLHARCPDAATQHPVMNLSGRGRPKIYPVDQIRRHVHLWHFCPESVCGLCSSPVKMGGRNVWTHRYKSATDAGSDSYLLNEHHQSICRDSFVGELFLTMCPGNSTQLQSIPRYHDKNICENVKL